MGKYQIGKDVQSMLVRLEKLEKRQRAKKELKVNKIASNFDFLVPSWEFKGIREKVIDKKGTNAVYWIAPFRSPYTWDSGSGGNLFVKGEANAKGKTGGCSISVRSSDRDVDNSDKASRFLEAYFGFGYRNPYAGGKLKVVAEYYIGFAGIADAIYDETGFSAIDFLDFQKFHLNAYKKVGDEYLKFGTKVSTIQKCRWKYRDGRGDKTCNHTKKEQSVTVTLTSDLDLEKNQKANIFVGIWSGLTLWTDDYSFFTHNACTIRLDKVTVSIV